MPAINYLMSSHRHLNARNWSNRLPQKHHIHLRIKPEPLCNLLQTSSKPISRLRQRRLNRRQVYVFMNSELSCRVLVLRGNSRVDHEAWKTPRLKIPLSPSIKVQIHDLIRELRNLRITKNTLSF